MKTIILGFILTGAALAQEVTIVQEDATAMVSLRGLRSAPRQ